jgi:hypothetical protein
MQLRIGSRSCLVLLTVFLSVNVPKAQEPVSRFTRSARPSLDSSKTRRKKLTPNQRYGLSVLEIAEAQAVAFEPAMRSFVLWQASRGYTRVDPAKADSLLRHSFIVTLSIETDGHAPENCSEAEFCGTKDWLQKLILREVIARSSRSQLELLGRAQPEVQRMLTGDLFQHSISEKRFDEARQLLSQMNENGFFPYDRAADLIIALPPEHAADRLEILSQALDSFNQSAADSTPQPGDLAELVTRAWRELPGSSVLHAISELLDQAKEADSSHGDLRVAFSTDTKTAYYDSQYKFRLFQLIPIVRELDPLQAERLLQENKDLESSVGHAGRAAQSGVIGKGEAMEGIDVVSTNNPVEAVAEEMQHAINRQQAAALAKAENDPKAALSEALRLPIHNALGIDYSPRAVTLRQVARLAARKDLAVSKAAIQEMSQIAENMPLRNQAQLLADSPEIYWLGGDREGARSALEQLNGMAAKLYELDSDLNDPNQAFKAMWPSTNLWRRCVEFASKFAQHSSGEEIIADIPDPEIKAFVEVAFANSLLGVENPTLSIIERHKKETHIHIVP